VLTIKITNKTGANAAVNGDHIEKQVSRLVDGDGVGKRLPATRKRDDDDDDAVGEAEEGRRGMAIVERVCIMIMFGEERHSLTALG